MRDTGKDRGRDRDREKERDSKRGETQTVREKWGEMGSKRHRQRQTHRGQEIWRHTHRSQPKHIQTKGRIEREKQAERDKGGETRR